jgi:alkylation response protein AidB-like acyl-CoA dehydrogenase
MIIDLTPEQAAFRDHVRAWFAANLPQDWVQGGLWPPRDEGAEQAFLVEWERRMHAAGLTGLCWPRDYGGQGRGIMDDLILSEEIGRHAAPETANTIGRELVGPILLSVGTEEQRRDLIPRILQAQDIWCQGFSEPGAGSDLAAIRTRADPDGDGWRINGQKIWTSYAHHATHCILLARSDPAAPSHRGLSLFILPMDTPGVEVRPIRHLNGLRHFNEVFLTDVRIGPDALIGQAGRGWQIAIEVLGYERATTRLYRQARFENELRALLNHADATGRLDDALRATAGGIAAELDILRAHNLRFVSRLASGARIGDEASFLKLLWSNIHQKIAALALTVLGPDLDADSPIATRFRRIYLTARGETVYAGSSQIQRNILSERVLGLPRGERRAAP